MHKAVVWKTRKVSLGGIVIMLLVALSGCVAGSGNKNDVADQGYVSGDGTLTTWSQSERGEIISLSGTDFAGESVDTSEFAGQILVINTWYAACPPCRAEAPMLAEVSKERAADGVQFIGINTVDEAGSALAFEEKHEITYPSIADGKSQTISKLQGIVPVKAVPTTLVLDKEHRVAARVLGQVDATTLNGLIDDVLADTTETTETT